MLRSPYTARTSGGSSYRTCFSYNPSSKPKPTLINNIYVDHLLETAENDMVKHEIRLAIMDERMRREEFILATSPHKVVANAVKYARAMNYTLNSLLDRRLKLLHEEFEQEFRRITEIQLQAYKDNLTKSVGYTKKQFRHQVSDVLSSRRREDELRRAKTELNLPSMHSSNSPSASRRNEKEFIASPIKRLKKLAWNNSKKVETSRRLTDEEKVAAEGSGRQFMTITSWKHDGEAVYFPPI